MSDGVIVAAIGAGSAVFAGVAGIALKGLFDLVKHAATVAVSSAETKAEVGSLKTTISMGLETQTREIGRVVSSVDKLTEAVDEHSHILKEHDERLRTVEGER